VGTAEFGNGTATVHQQIAASALTTAVAKVYLKQSDTANGGHDTGAYGSTGTVVAGLASERAARSLHAMILDFAAQHSGALRESCTLAGEAVTCAGKRIALTDLQRAAVAAGVELSASGHSDGKQRSVAFNVQGFRVAVNPVSGEIRILKSVQAADAGTVINPMQCRGQVEGGVAQALGAALFEEVVVDASGRVANPTFRHYHLPAFVDVPRTQVLFADTCDALGPLGAKSMSESPYNPVAAALGNAIRDATGVRFYKLPFKPDRIFAQLMARTESH
jgi:CO/xanthine dehydrogenase Mo-binding subunit